MVASTLTACSTLVSGEARPTQNATFDFIGALTLIDENGPKSGSCTGINGYDDIHGGTAVTVYDGAGTLIGTGQLDEGLRNPFDGNCLFGFTVADIPRLKGFYQYEISHRGKLSLTEAEATAVGSIQAVLGN